MALPSYCPFQPAFKPAGVKVVSEHFAALVAKDGM